MLQGTSATARSVSVSSGQTRRALAISPSSVSCLPALSAFQRVAAVAPRTHVGGGCANHRPGKRAHRCAPAASQPAIVLGPTTVVGRRFYARPSAAVPAQHHCACLSLCAAGGCTSLRGAVTPNPSLQRTRQKRRAAELQVVGRHYQRSLTPNFGLASIAVLSFAGVVSRSNAAGNISNCA